MARGFRDGFMEGFGVVSGRLARKFPPVRELPKIHRWLVGIAAVGMITGPVGAQAAESVMVVEAHSGRILVAQESGRERPVASLTKIATAMVALDWAKAAGVEPEDVRVVVPPSATGIGGPNAMNLVAGESMTLRDALFSAMLGSDNIAAMAVADTVGGKLQERRGRGGDPVAAFVSEMNRLAGALGMKDTRFINPHGLTGPGSKGASTAADIARLAIHAMRNPALSFIVRQKQRTITVQGTAGPRSFRVKNTNELLGDKGVTGIKTGTTTASGPCLATCVERDPLLADLPDGRKSVTPRRLIVVVLNSPDRFGRTRALIERGWGIYDQWRAGGSTVGNARREFLQVPELP
jgi:D-alanyl-D-alanine carboxypeptidase (penicillin-binding protein 5/6)